MSNVVQLRANGAITALENMLALAKAGHIKEVFVFAPDEQDDGMCNYVITHGMRLRDLLLARHTIEQLAAEFWAHRDKIRPPSA